MSKVKKFFQKFADMFGFKRSSKYVADYLHEANMRSGTFMAAVIVILEIWLVFRQTQKYVIKAITGGTPFFQATFQNLWTYFLLMSLGVAMFLYCLQYISHKNTKTKLILITVFAGLSIALCCFLPFEFKYKSINFAKGGVYVYRGVFKLIFYASIVFFDVAVILASIYRYIGGTKTAISSVLVISLFAFVCLAFGIMISYGDFTGTKVFYDAAGNPIIMADGVSYAYEHKQIICFLMMSIYIGCLLIWRPYVSIGILGSIFLGFYIVIDQVSSFNGRRLPEGDEVNYITFFISLAMVSISIFNQRIHEARKDERLEQLAKVDDLTGLMTYSYFISESDKKADEEKAGANKYAFLFFNISSFKTFNDQRGYEAGNRFLTDVGQIIQNTFPGAFVSRQADDHFVAYVENDNLIEKFNLIREQVRELDEDLKPNITIGYNVVIDEHEAKAGVEKARYANAYLKHIKKNDYYQYNQKLHDQYELVQYIVSHIDEAVEEGWIVPYYQPVVFSKDGTLCGAEALARWVDPKYGFLNPGVFIGALEDAHLAYKLDLAMLNLVCKNMRDCLDKKEKVLPTSINISRSDFSVIDVASEITKITEKYGISKEFLHIEITESALLDAEVDLLEESARIKKNGFALWLDDFGSGYSSFNALKDFAFDVVKLDMEFLKGFEKNEKSKPIIESVLKMANSINMSTLCEGVETKEQAEFLKKIGCVRLQGYYVSKPITYKELTDKIANKEFVLSKDL